MDENELMNLLEYSDNRSILIVNSKGRLEELTCPFKVRVIQDVGELEKGDIVVVNQVKITIKVITVYSIKGKAYYYFYFELFL